MSAETASGWRPEFVFSGDGVLYVLFPDRIDRAVNRAVLSLFDGLRALALPGVAELVPGYRSLMIAFDPRAVSDDRLVAAVHRTLAEDYGLDETQTPVTIPVVYDGPDLPVVARHTGLSPDEVVALHSEADYDVFFVGFTPGFPFLGGMPPRLATPRRTQPRLRVEAGSVGIAGSQTGIYPLPSPGGWQIIGRTPLALCDLRPEASTPVLLQPGQRVRLQVVDEVTFARLAAEQRPRSQERPGTGDDGA